MALSRDPETLRVPAFMRKRNIRTRLARPLLLTALDRKNAGVVLPELQKPKRTQRIKKTKNQEIRSYHPANATSYSWPMLPLHERKKPKVKKKRITRKKIKIPETTTTDYFTEPLLGFAELEEVKPKKSRRVVVRVPHHDTKSIGTITHYYGKIEVGVIKLKGALSVGDCISYETPEGDYEQIVESMEIDRVPVFKAKKGDDIGLKLRRIAKIGSKVIKI